MGDYTLLKSYIGIDDEVAGKESGKAIILPGNQTTG